MSNKFELYKNRCLKIVNVLSCKIVLEEIQNDLAVKIEQAQSYIRSKGGVQIGPLIQKSKVFTNEDNGLDMGVWESSIPCIARWKRNKNWMGIFS